MICLFTVYLLAKHPAVEEKLVHEVRAFYDKLDEAGADNVEKRPSYDELVQFPFVEQVHYKALLSLRDLRA